MLISPFSIFHSSGSSSRLVERRNLPNLVNLSLSDNNSPNLSFLSIIVLNLYIVNIFSFNPGLCCLNIIGLPSLTLTNIATISITGPNIISAIKDNMKSKILLIYFLYIFITTIL